MKLRASQITPTSISPDLNAGRQRVRLRIQPQPVGVQLQHERLGFIEIGGGAALQQAGAHQNPGRHGADHADLALPFRVQQIGETLRRFLHILRIIDNHLGAVDMRHEPGRAQIRQHVLQVRYLRLVERFHQAGLGRAIAVDGAQASDVHRAVRQHLRRGHLRIARRLVADILDHRNIGRFQDRIVDILPQQSRVVAAPGADDAGFRRRRPGGSAR